MKNASNVDQFDLIRTPRISEHNSSVFVPQKSQGREVKRWEWFLILYLYYYIYIYIIYLSNIFRQSTHLTWFGRESAANFDLHIEDQIFMYSVNENFQNLLPTDS